MFAHSSAFAINIEPPPNPGFVNSVLSADVIADVEILSGGPFRAAALARKVLKGDAPKVFEIEGYNSYNWDTVHQGLASGSRYVLFLSRTGRPGVYATLTPAAPKFSIEQDAILLELGDPPFRIPVKIKSVEEGIKLILEQAAGGKPPERAEAVIRGMWDEGEVESRYLAVSLAGAMRDPRLIQLLSDASKDKLLKLRLTAIESLGEVASPEAVNTLCILLKDEKPTITREAARVLLSIRHADNLPELLEWARRASAPGHAVTPAVQGKPDANRQKTDLLIGEIVRFAAECGPLLEPDAVCRPLFDLARAGAANDQLARAAFAAIAENARGPQIAALIELADDRTYEHRAAAVDALQQITLKNERDSAAFRTWWSDSGSGFNDDLLRDVTDAAAAGLSGRDADDDRRTLRDVLRHAPAETALIAEAPLQFAPETEGEFGSDDVALWPSPIAAPLLAERLGRNSIGDRRSAIEALTRLCSRSPRLRSALWPLLRAELCDEDSGCRRAAHTAVGLLTETDGIPALLDSLQIQYSYPRFEAYEAYRGIYNCSARTLGFATNEPIPDEIAAQSRLRGWWDGVKSSFVAQPFNAARLPIIGWPDADARTARLEAMALGAARRPSAAAFAMLLAERPAGDALWTKMLGLPGARDRAHGLIGLYGGDATAVAELARSLEDGPILCRAIAMTGLATLRGANNTMPGAAKLIEWLKGPGAKADPGWRRLGVISLGLCDGDSASRAFLSDTLDAALAPKPVEDDAGPDKSFDKPSENYALLKPLLIAFGARSDATDLLVHALKELKSADLKLCAARELSLRRQSAAIVPIIKALESTDRFSWTDLARALAPLLRDSDAKDVRDLLDDDATGPRDAAAFLLYIRPDIGRNPETAEKLINALKDHSSTVRYYAAMALGKRKEISAIRALLALLEDDDSQIRGAAAEALGNIGDPFSCRMVVRAAMHEDHPGPEWLTAMAVSGSEVFFQEFLRLCNSNLFPEQQAGMDAMGVLNRPEALDLLLKTFRNDEAAMQTQAFDALSRRGASVVEALNEDLKQTDKTARARAIHLLAHIDTRGSRELLAKISGDANEDPSLRALAEFGLQRLKTAKDQ